MRNMESSPAESPAGAATIEREHAKISEQVVTVTELVIQGALAGFCATGAATVAAAAAPVSISVGLLATLGGLRFWIARRSAPPRWMTFTSIVADFALYFLILIAFHWRPGADPSLTLEAPTFAFVFVIVALRALRFNLTEMAVAGTVAALGWLLLTVFAIATAGPALEGLNVAKIIIVQIERIVAIGCFCGVICLASQRGAKYLRRASEEAERAKAALAREKQLSARLIEEAEATAHANRRLFQAANFDRLTKLENRFAFMRRAEKAAAAPVADQTRTYAVAVIDLNRFRSFNDGLGRAAGDALLREAAKRLKAALQPGESVARVGPDEFAVLLPCPRSANVAGVLAQRLKAALTEPIEAAGHKFIAGATVGIAVAEPEDSAVSVFSFADIALNEAKRAGGRGFHIHDPAGRPQIGHRVALEHALRGAVARDELVLHYQPLVRLADRSIGGWEALVRWSRDGGDVVGPGTFIPIAEETGTIVDIGAWALERAALDARRFAEAGADAKAFVSVNVSPRQFADPQRLTGAVREAVRAYPWLKLEVTESAVVDDPVSALALLETLRRSGAELSLDDFGTGTSSLSQLRRFPFTTLKIDQSFVRDDSPSGRRYLRSIVGIANALDIATVAEGIETHADLAACDEYGVTFGQGYLLGRPEAAEVILQACSVQSIAAHVRGEAAFGRAR